MWEIGTSFSALPAMAAPTLVLRAASTRSLLAFLVSEPIAYGECNKINMWGFIVYLCVCVRVLCVFMSIYLPWPQR